jgi:hypothetical protein
VQARLRELRLVELLAAVAKLPSLKPLHAPCSHLLHTGVWAERATLVNLQPPEPQSQDGGTAAVVVATGGTPEASEVSAVTGGDPADTTAGSHMHSGASPQLPQLNGAILDTPLVEGGPPLGISHGKNVFLHGGSRPPSYDVAGQGVGMVEDLPGLVLGDGRGALRAPGLGGRLSDLPLGSPSRDPGADPLSRGSPLMDDANMEDPDV